MGHAFGFTGVSRTAKRTRDSTTSPVENALVLKPLTEDELFAKLCDVVETQRWSVAVTLLTGDVVVGGLYLRRVPYADVGKKRYAYYPKFWPAPRDGDAATALWLKDIVLLYPSGERTSGTSALELEAGQVAAIRTVGWRLDVGLAGITGVVGGAINASNEGAASRAGIRTSGFVAASMAVPRQVETKGIWFESYEPIYIDYDYFGRMSSVDFTLAVPGFEAQYSRGAEAVAKAALEGSFGKLIGVAPPLVRETGGVAPAGDDLSIEMEGGVWHLALLIRPTNSVHGETIPVLFRGTAARYPLELWQYIRSPLTILAEDRQIPIQSGDREWQRTLTARAIAYLP